MSGQQQNYTKKRTSVYVVWHFGGINLASHAGKMTMGVIIVVTEFDRDLLVNLIECYLLVLVKSQHLQQNR